MSKLSIYGVVFLLFFTVVIGLLTDNNDFEGTKPETLIVEEHLETEEVDELDEVAITTNAETPVARDTESVATDSTLYRVLRVIDGDTIMIDRDGIAERVRMVGIDTPETVHPSKSVECFGREASDKTKSWLEGRRVRLVADSIEGERDKYQRLLGYVYRDDGLFINCVPARKPHDQ